MGVISFNCTFGADICGGCGKKNKKWLWKNFHNKKCLEMFIKNTNKLYDSIILNGNSDIKTVRREVAK